MKKSLTQGKNNYAPCLPEEEINKIVRELSDPNLVPFPPYTESTEEELLLIKVLNRKLREGKIRAEMTNDGKLWLKTTEPILGGVTQIKYKVSPCLEKKIRQR